MEFSVRTNGILIATCYARLYSSFFIYLSLHTLHLRAGTLALPSRSTDLPISYLAMLLFASLSALLFVTLNPLS